MDVRAAITTLGTVGSHTPYYLGIIPLFSSYLTSDTLELAAIAGFDSSGRLRAFTETVGDAASIDTVLPQFRTVLGETTVTEIVIAHSHPFATALPSAQDRITTDRLSALARLAGAFLGEHFIFGTDGIYSIAEGRLIKASASR